MFDVYIKQSAVEKAERYFSQFAADGLEGMGLLVGSEYEHKGQRYVLVSEFITGDTASSPVSVRFSPTAFQHLAEKIKHKLKDEIVIGWCHSHPSYGCFLSSTDINTQRRFFNEDFHIAAVFDPLRMETFSEKEFMSKRVYRLNGDSYNEVSFAVIK